VQRQLLKLTRSPGRALMTSSSPIDLTEVLYETTVTLAANQNRTLVLLNDCASATSCNQNILTTLRLEDLN
jgi:hypothetical protein